MAVSWFGTGTLLGSTGADITPTLPASTAANDILICMAASRDVTETCLTPSGWTLKSGPTDNTAWRVYVFYKRAAGGDANPLLDWSAAVGEKYGQVHAVRGAITSGDPFAAAALTVDLTDPIVSTGVTTTAANQYVMAVGIGSDNASASVTVTATDPATWTQRHYSTIMTGADAAGSFHDQVRATAGATGNVTNDHNSTMPAMGVFVAAVTEAVLVAQFSMLLE